MPGTGHIKTTNIWVYSKNLGVSTTEGPHELITTISDYKEFGFLRNHLAFLVMGEAIWICGGEQQFFSCSVTFYLLSYCKLKFFKVNFQT